MSVLSQWKLVVGFLVVFFAGVVCGGLGSLRWVGRTVAERMDVSTWQPKTMQWLQDEVGLTDDQAAAVEPTVELAIADLIELRDRTNKERRAIMGRMLLEITSELDSEQREQLKQAIHRAEQRRRTWSR